ncbi:MAG: hypothetical protein IPM89_11245 [Candidatus Competibacteraceae bacterium]|nr:MAG: hypothetical protein IPM89_11245 [Candidatus Competibacteraceae bacterium]
MSEYQYYEFLAIDRPLSAKEIAELRALSTRARITPTSFVNEYHWGDFKGSPDTLMRRYFDAHVYLANWGQCHFSLRLPHDALDAETAAAYTTKYAFLIKETGEHWVIDWSLNESEDYDRFGEDDGCDWMARLTPLRDELLCGEQRALYLGWLAAVEAGEVKDEQLEPPVPAGMQQPTSAQRALVKFLGVGLDLLTAATIASTAAVEDVPAPEERETWLDTVPANETRELLHLLLDGRGQQAERTLKARFAAWQRERRPSSVAGTPRRTVAELRRLAEEVAQLRLRREAEAHARADAERRKQREAYLSTLARDFDRAWATADQQAERGVASAYDEVRRAVVDLAEAYQRHASHEQFEQALQRFMAPHRRRTTLVKRLADAGLWKKR